MGMSEFYGATNEEENLRVLQKAIDIGCTFWDTADQYGIGKNEELLGKTLKSQRDKVFLCTKFGIVREPDGGRRICGTPEYVKQACDASLKRLGVSQIDLYYQHRVDPNVPIEDTVKAMKELQSEGKIRFIGLSECSAETLKRAAKIVHIDAVQVEYSPWTLDIETNGLLAACRELGTVIVAYSPLGRGMLTGRYKSPDDFEEGDFRKINPRFQGENFKKNLKLVEVLQGVAAKKGCTSSQLVLAWVIAQGDNFIPIPGTKNEKYLLENVGCATVHLTTEDLAEIRKSIEAIEVVGTRYPEAGMKSVNV